MHQPWERPLCGYVGTLGWLLMLLDKGSRDTRGKTSLIYKVLGFEPCEELERGWGAVWGECGVEGGYS